MDIEKQSTQWAKSTEERIQMFLDNYLIRSPLSAVRTSSQRLILSLFKKGNAQQKLRIMSLLQSRCQQLTWMGRASQDFLNLVKNIFSTTEDYAQNKKNIIRKIFANLEKVHKNVISNLNYQFYCFTSNLIDFGNEQFKPYLLEANGCLGCFGCSQSKSQNFKLQNCLQTIKLFNNKVQYVFKRIYDVKDLSINFKITGKMKAVTAYYIDSNKQYKKISNNKFKPGQIISASALTLQGIMFEFDIAYGNLRKIKCIFCDASDDLNSVCQNCAKRGEMIQISGTFKIAGADQELITQQLCQDYQKIQQNVNAIKNLHRKMQTKQKISLNFKLDEMVEIYQRIVNNLGLLHKKSPSKLKSRQDQNCFSCNYYQMVNIVKFLKEIIKKCSNIPLLQQQISDFKEILRNCIISNQIQSLKTSLLQTLAIFIVYLSKPNYSKQFQNKKSKFTAQLISKVLIALKQKRNISQNSIEDELSQIKTFLQQKSISLQIQQKIEIFTCYFLDWQIMSLVLNNTFNHSTQVNRLTSQQFQQLSFLIDFDMSEIFNINLNSYLKAFLKIVPETILPAASLQIADCQFLQYVDNKIPQIQKSKIEQLIICCPNPMIRLDMFTSLPILVTKLPVKQSMKVMNCLFPFRNAWNLNITKACKKFDAKLSELPPQQQIYTCLYGYYKSKQFLYIQKIFKLLVPQRLQFIVRFQAPYDEIQNAGIQYPYLPIRQVKSQELAGDTIKALHEWVYNQLVKLNQAMPLDIIVQKNIIDDMDLPIQLVYQNISENKSKKKIGNKQYQFFKVIYRIQGVLGQPKQRSIGNLRDQKLQACISYASYFLNKFSDQFSKKIGLDAMIQILQQIQQGQQYAQKKMVLFEILYTLSMNQAICKKIIQGQYGDSIINATVRLMSFQNEKDAKITNFLLKLSSKVIDEANQQMINLRKGSVGQYRKMSGGMDIQQNNISQSQKKVRFVVDKINQCQSSYEKTGNILYRDITRRLIKLLPFCSKDQTQPTQLLFNYFQFANWVLKHHSKMENLIIFMESLSQSYMTFKCIAHQKGITNQIIKTITNCIRKQGTQQIDQKKLSVNKSQNQSALLLLCSLIQGDQSLQSNLFETKIFHNIYQISQIPPKKAIQINAGRVPQHCYKIIKYLSQGKIIQKNIAQFLNSKKKAQKEKLEPKKMKKWEMMKNKQKIALGNIMENQGEQTEKDLIICSSCQQGYSKKKQILGFYIYQSKNQIPYQINWWKDSRRSASFTSSTYLTAIHFECHHRAYQADQKIQRSEWDGALIRNMDVLCNSWIPFKGPKTTPEQFARVQRKYFEKNKSGTYWNTVNDLQTLIQKLSKQFDFAAEIKGSSSSHNFRYIPILIGFNCHLIERAGGCSNIQDGIAYLMDNPPKKLWLVNYFLCYSLFVMNYDWFLKNKPYFYKWIIDHKTQAQGQSQDKIFQTLKPYLIFLRIIQQIFQIIHKPMQTLNINSQQKIYKQLDTHLANNFQHIIPQFEQLNTNYKTKYSKYTKFNEFQTQLKIVV